MALKKIEKTISKYLINQASFKELDDLEVWIENAKNEKDFIDYVKINYSIDYNLKKTDTYKTKKIISTLINERKKELRVKKILSYTKYAAVLVVGFFLTMYVFKDALFGNSSNSKPTPVIVNTIVPGTDKATLTIEDGSQITLEKGTSFQTQNASSNGEQLVYDRNKKKVNKLVYNYLTIPRGGEFYIVLSDGTKVWLNSDSQLKYPVHFIKGKKRQVELVYGEAYFEVTSSALNKGAKFIVLNKSQEIEVLGTAFNVKAYKDESNIYTTLTEGKVAVKYENGTENLLPNQQLSLNVETKSTFVQEVDVYNEISWKDGLFSFEKKSLEDIMKVLSRWYDVNVIFEDNSLEEVKFFGVLGKDQNIEDILKTIKNFKIIKEYEIKGKTIKLK